MSQIYRSKVSSSDLPPDVPTEFDTQNGNAVPAANILIISATGTEENNTDGIQTVGGGVDSTASNEVQIQLTNRIYGTATSTNASNADIITFALSASPAVYRFSIDVAGRGTAGSFVGEGVGYTLFGGAKTDGATATVIQTAFSDNDEDADLKDATIEFIASGNSVILRAVGISGETISYAAVGSYLVI